MNVLTKLENISENKNNISSVSNTKVDKVFKSESLDLKKNNTINNKDNFKEKEISNSIYYFDKKAKEFILKISKQGLDYQFPSEQILKIKEFVLKNEKEINVI